MAKDLRTMQKEEAVRRLTALKLHRNVVKDFENGKVNYSVRHNNIFDGILYWVDDDKKIADAIKKFEKERDMLVYHAQLTQFTFGTCLTMLYVSKYIDEWEMDYNDILNEDENGVMCVYAYAYNLTDPDLSDLGRVGIVRKNGGISRVW